MSTEAAKPAKLLIQGAPGVRIGFVNALLRDKLTNSCFDVGAEINPGLYMIDEKLHDYNQDYIMNFSGKSIGIKMSLNLLERHLYLFQAKNIKIIAPELVSLHYTHRLLIDKLYYSAKTWYNQQCSNDYSIFDHVITFEDTFNIDKMFELYFVFNKKTINQSLKHAAITTNQCNLVTIPKNHSCRIAAAIFNFELENNLAEHQRLWSFNSVGKFTDEGICLDPENLYQNISQHLTLEYYDTLR
jgi:hypothetical protein